MALTGPGQPRGPSPTGGHLQPRSGDRWTLGCGLGAGPFLASESMWPGSLQDTPQRPRPPPKGTGLRRRYQERLAARPGLPAGTPAPCHRRC